MGVLAAAAVVVVLGIGLLAATTLVGRPPAASSVNPSVGSSVAIEYSGAPSMSPAPSAEVGTSLLDVLLAHPITVGEANERRDTSLDDTELAVSGFGWVARNDVPCPMVRVAVPALIQCSTTMLLESSRTPIFNDGPAAPSLDLAVQPETLGDVSIPTTDPLPMIVLGHFDDHRANSCPPQQLEMCRKEFVVDATVDASDRRLDRPTDVNRVDPQARPRLTIDQAIGTMGLHATDPGIVAAFAVRTAVLSELEPAIAHAPELRGARIIWMVRWVEREKSARPVIRTRIVADRDPSSLGLNWWYDVTPVGLAPGLVPGEPSR